MLPDFGWSGHVTSIFLAVASKRARALCSNKNKINQTKKEQIYFCRRSPTFILLPARMWVLRDQTQPELFSHEKEEAGNKVLLVPGRRDNFPPLPSLLRDQTQPGLFSREKEEAENKVWSRWVSEQLPHPSPPCCMTRLIKGNSLKRKKKQGIKFGVPARRDNFPTPPLPAA